MIVGDGEEKQYLESKIKDSRLANLKLVPAVTELDKYYEWADILFITSRSEAFPMVLIESMSFGVIGLSYNDLVGPSEIIIDNVNGLLVDRNNFSYIKDLLISILENKSEFKAISQNAINSSHLYSGSAVNASWEKLMR